jgi:hypothetical protein
MSLTSKDDINGNAYANVLSHGLVGPPFAVPSATTNGALVGTPPTGYVGIAFIIPVNATLAYTVATTAPGSAPVSIPTITNNTGSVMWLDLNIIAPNNFYITVMTGGVTAIWYV